MKDGGGEDRKNKMNTVAQETDERPGKSIRIKKPL